MMDPVVPINLGWQPFSWGSGPDAPDLEGPFTFTTLTSVILTVTDAYCVGDQFRVLDNGVPIGVTPAVPVPSECMGNKFDPDDAVQDPAYGHTSFNLPVGIHSITVEAINNPFNSGGAFLPGRFLYLDVVLLLELRSRTLAFSRETRRVTLVGAYNRILLR